MSKAPLSSSKHYPGRSVSSFPLSAVPVTHRPRAHAQIAKVPPRTDEDTFGSERRGLPSGLPDKQGQAKDRGQSVGNPERQP